jgi:hypothetical protein
MSVEAKTAKHVTHDEPGFQPEHAGARVGALSTRVEVAVAGMGMRTIPDWAALRLEIHQKLRELKKSGDGCWQRAKSELELRIAALENSIQAANRGFRLAEARIPSPASCPNRPPYWAEGRRTKAL